MERVTSNDAWRRYLEMGATVGELTVARAEEIARGLVAEDDEVRARAWREVDQLARFGLRMGEQLLDLAKDRLETELRTRSADTLDLLLERLGDLVSPPGGEEVRSEPDDSIPVVASESPRSATTVLTPAGVARPSDGEASDRPRNSDKTNRDKTNRDKRDKKNKQPKKKARPAPMVAGPGEGALPTGERLGKDGTKGKPDSKKHKKKGKETAATAEQPPVRVLALAHEPGSDDTL